jgi:hypothetical protein
MSSPRSYIFLVFSFLFSFFSHYFSPPFFRKKGLGPKVSDFFHGGRSQAVRQWIVTPLFAGSMMAMNEFSLVFLFKPQRLAGGWSLGGRKEWTITAEGSRLQLKQCSGHAQLPNVAVPVYHYTRSIHPGTYRVPCK